MYERSITGVKLTSVSSLEFLEEWDIHNSQDQVITEYLSKNLPSSFNHHNQIYLVSILYSAELYMTPTALEKFTTTATTNFNPTFLKIHIIDDKQLDIFPVEFISTETFKRLIGFELYSVTQPIDTVEQLIQILGDQIRRITLFVPELNLEHLSTAINKLNYLCVKSTFGANYFESEQWKEVAETLKVKVALNKCISQLD
ncbi:hypothetical protein KGF54_000385 [Candida jiufengensis]|uniref:uncharacterized protein n=1 Tax=Candida jiufengensis TaxID=497108 RepID=UPI002223F81D|nr:uncharacterized protein KGF54_000385 [Candida jiufengensis]KAI5956768.1 hypothetical protein KGF54_000385 [Candida jiufengensis]